MTSVTVGVGEQRLERTEPADAGAATSATAADRTASARAAAPRLADQRRRTARRRRPGRSPLPASRRGVHALVDGRDARRWTRAARRVMRMAQRPLERRGQAAARAAPASTAPGHGRVDRDLGHDRARRARRSTSSRLERPAGLVDEHARPTGAAGAPAPGAAPGSTGRVTSSERAAPAAHGQATAPRRRRAAVDDDRPAVGRRAGRPARRRARSAPSAARRPRAAGRGPAPTATSSRARASAGTSAPAASQSARPGPSGSGSPSTAGTSPAEVGEQRPAGGPRGRGATASEAATTVVPAAALGRPAGDEHGDLHGAGTDGGGMPRGRSRGGRAAEPADRTIR